MTAQSQLEEYLGAFRHRLKSLIVARAAALMALAALVITLVAVYFGARRAFDPTLVIGARAILALALAGIALGVLAYPLRKLRKTRGISDIERRAPEFDGRLETYDGLTHSPEQKRSPFLGLLAEDALGFARRIPILTRVPAAHVNAPVIVAVVAGVMLLGMGAFGPDNWRYGVRHLWAGWLIDDTLPPQRIDVIPGDGTVRRGGDLTVSARADGFAPVEMELFAQFDPGGAWQSTYMTSVEDDAFEFTLFAIREPVSYYVSAAGIRSPEYTVDVVDLPEITNIRLTYDYPEWTRLDPLTEDPGNDILAVAGTAVTVEIETDRPLETATLEANGESIPMTVAGNLSTASLEVNEEGEYFISTLFDQDTVRLSDDYFISVVADKEPVVKVVKPGRDWRASNIEEVTVRVEATDDFGLDRVELRYSINGAEWQSAELAVESNTVEDEEVLYLEDMTKPVPRPRARSLRSRQGAPLTLESLRALRERNQSQPAEEVDAEETPAAPEFQGLEPGDLISYYIVAEDREQTVQTDLFFIEVQPFDRRFTQATAGGGGGGGGGQQQDEISARQKEILVATWNLIREQSEEASFLDEQQMLDNARMLSGLQRTLAEQARTLASRTRARQLTNADEQIERFVESLELAADAMDPAVERLADVALEEAVPSEQEALQHLLRAESVFSDIQVSFQRGGGGGAGGLAGRDLSELFELEMDLEKNQYETDSPAAFNNQETPEQEVDEAIAKLQELARRQENLARQTGRRNNVTEQERWQQEQLRRETEELRRQLEELQQRMAEQQAQQQGQQQQGQQGQQGQQQGQPGQGGQTAQNAGQQTQGGVSSDAMRDLDNALQAMNRASQNAESMDPEQVRRAIEQARRELDQALEQMTAQRQMEAVEAFSDLAERSSELYSEQREVAAELQSELQRALDEQIANSARRGGLDREAAIELSDRKLEMQEELEALEQDIQRVAQEFRSRTPGASEELIESLADLQQSQAVARLQYGAAGIRQGAAQQVAAIEAVTTSALRDLERSTREALERARVEAVRGEDSELDPNAELVAEIQALRRQLTAMAAEEAQDGGQSGQPGQPGQQQGQGNQAQAGGQFAAGGDFRGNRFGGGRGFYDPNRTGLWDVLNSDVWQDPEAIERLREQLNDAGRQLLTTSTRLRGEGVSEEELRAVRELGEALRAGLTGNPELVAREYQALVNLAEQLELRLRDGAEGGETGTRAEAPSQFAPGYEEETAEYYRRLSRGDL